MLQLMEKRFTELLRAKWAVHGAQSKREFAVGLAWIGNARDRLRQTRS
jgi:hypothetical protein